MALFPDGIFPEKKVYARNTNRKSDGKYGILFVIK
jgi:hypothetical protein